MTHRFGIALSSRARRAIAVAPIEGRLWLALGTAVLVAACSPGGNATPPPSASSNGAVATGATFASYDPGVVAGGPGSGQRYSLGRTPTRAEAAWKTEVGPDGRELPAGRGTVAQGAALYQAKCAMCHNTKGQGMPPVYPALIGRDPKGEGFHFASDPKLVKTIGNYWPYATTVFDYVRRAMPYTAPGSLSNDQVYALTAFLLAQNQVIPGDATLDAKALRKVKMPYADRFVPDDRRGGPEVR